MDEVIVIWTNNAIKQRDYIFDYWNKRNKSLTYSTRLNKLIYDRIDLIKINHKIGIETDFNLIRKISIGHYSILYKLKLPKIYIIAFWDNRQDPRDLIKFLQK